MGNFLNSCDHFADPVSLTFKGKRGHSTAFGGFISFVSTVAFVSYFFWRTAYLFDHSRDDYMMSTFFTEFSDRKPYMLKDSDFTFRVHVVDEDYDNDDNPYGEIKLHKYYNIEN